MDYQTLETPSLKSITKTIKLISTYKEYNFDIASYVSYRHFWDWRKQNLINEDSVLDGSRSFPGKDKVNTKMHLHGYFWLRILASLKEFGVRSDKIRMVMETVYQKVDISSLFDGITDEGLISILKQSSEIKEVEKAQIIKYVLSGEIWEDIEKSNIDYLFVMLYRLIYHRHDIKLIVLTDGSAFFHDSIDSADSFENIIDGKQVIVLQLREYLIDIISDYRHVSFLTRYGSLKEEEAEVLDIIRDKEVKYLKVNLKDGKPEKVTISKNSNTNANQKLSSYLIKGGYEDILIKTNESKITYSTKSENKRLTIKDT